MRITLISDTHGLHNQIETFLEGGDLIIHAGDSCNYGYLNELNRFCVWYNSDRLKYTNKIFIAGNHDKSFENDYDGSSIIVDYFPNIKYLQDESHIIKDGDTEIKLYGTPWQPEFYNWAFMLPRNGPGLSTKWEQIPDDTTILITHTPPQSILDKSGSPHNEPLLGCELLYDRVKQVKPKIHLFGHIHGSYGYYFDGNTHFINASVLNEQYVFTNKPLTIDWDPITNEIIFL